VAFAQTDYSAIIDKYMIPTFPEFKKIEISDQAEIENFTKIMATVSI
jgi:hypothetical protein